MDGWEFRRIAQAIYLMPRTPWSGRRLADSGVLTLEDAAHFASAHAGQEITPEDFLRAAARGEVRLLAMARRDVWMTRIPLAGEVLPEHQRRKRVRADAWASLPVYACRQLAAAGSASWRTEEELEQDERGVWWHVDSWMLEPDEPPFDAAPADCRVTGFAMHALADAFLLYAQEREGAGNQSGAAGEPQTQPQVQNVKRWTPERVNEARVLVERLKADGERAPMEKAAEHFDVSATRLREVFRRNPEVRLIGAVWPTNATKQHRIK